MNTAKTNVAGGDENHHPNNASRSRPAVFLPPQGPGIHLSAGQLALWDKDHMKSHGREVIYSTMTNLNNDSLLLSLNEQVVAKTMEQLRGLLWGRYNQVYGTLPHRPGAPQTIAKAMHLHPGSDMIQEYGCDILFHLLSGENRITIVNVSGIVMPNESTWAKPMVDAGCVEAVIFAMKSHPYKVNVQYGGCRFLCDLAGKSRPNTNDVNDDDVYRQRIIDAQGLKAVGEARRIHQHAARVVRISDEAIFAILSPL